MFSWDAVAGDGVESRAVWNVASELREPIRMSLTVAVKVGRWIELRQ